jgi:hypothetical protein
MMDISDALRKVLTKSYQRRSHLESLALRSLEDLIKYKEANAAYGALTELIAVAEGKKTIR